MMLMLTLNSFLPFFFAVPFHFFFAIYRRRRRRRRHGTTHQVALPDDGRRGGRGGRSGGADSEDLQPERAVDRVQQLQPAKEERSRPGPLQEGPGQKRKGARAGNEGGPEQPCVLRPAPVQRQGILRSLVSFVF